LHTPYSAFGLPDGFLCWKVQDTGRKEKVESKKWEVGREKGEGRREPLSKGENEYVVK